MYVYMFDIRQNKIISEIVPYLTDETEDNTSFVAQIPELNVDMNSPF